MHANNSYSLRFSPLAGFPQLQDSVENNCNATNCLDTQVCFLLRSNRSTGMS